MSDTQDGLSKFIEIIFSIETSGLQCIQVCCEKQFKNFSIYHLNSLFMDTDQLGT